MTTLAVAIVGSGVISHNHVAALVRLPRLRIVAVVDPVADANKQLTASLEALGQPAPAEYADLATALVGTPFDLVVICTPSGTHADVAEIALAAGKHVVVEKPLDADLAAGRRLVAAAAAAQARGQHVSVISQHRFDPGSVAIRQAIVDGRLGRVTSAVASVAWWRGQAYYDSAGWRGTWELDGGGATMNQGVHTVDLLLWFLGTPVELYAYTGKLAHERIAVEDVAVATLRFESGAVAVLHATTAAYPGLAVRLQVHGDRGSAVLHDDQLEYFHTAESDGGVGSRGEGGATANQAADVVPPGEVRGAPKPPDFFVVGHYRQFVDIVDAIDQGRPAGVPVSEALLATATVKALYVSATLGRPVLIADVLAGVHDGVEVRV